MQTVDIQMTLTAPLEEALRLAAWQDDTSVGAVLRGAILRDIQRRQALGARQVAQRAGREMETATPM